MIKTKTMLLMLFLLISSPSMAQQKDEAIFQGYDTAFVVYDRVSGEVVNFNPERSQKRLAPCSTFKIYNTLIGLELGLLKGADDPWYTWDGVERFIEGWNRDLTLREAFRVSAVPAYQELARHIGAERMETYIDEIHYGNRDVSAGIDRFWLPSATDTPIQISADEQVDLLNALLDGKLPFQDENIQVLKDIMRVSETDKGTLYGKTGSGMGADGQWNLGWFVGFVESRGKTYVFACNITGGESPSGLAARALVEEYLIAEGLL